MEPVSTSIVGKFPVRDYKHEVVTNPLVSVLVVAYNHENYIVECLESILAQKTNFPFEILLGEDDSNDRTREICIEYANKYPSIIRLFLHDRRNTITFNGRATGRFNWVYSLNQANGCFLALCDGDDYWTSPYKLQQQVDTLQASPTFSGCAHNTLVFNESSSKFAEQPIVGAVEKTIFTIDDFVRGEIYFHTSSMLYRLSRIKKCVFDFYSESFGDWFLCTKVSELGPIKYLDNTMSVYRIHESGVWSELDEFEKLSKNLSSIISYNRVLKFKYEVSYLSLFVRVSLDKFKLHEKELLELIKRFEASDIIKIVRFLYTGYSQCSEEKNLISNRVKYLDELVSEKDELILEKDELLKDVNDCFFKKEHEVKLLKNEIKDIRDSYEREIIELKAFKESVDSSRAWRVISFIGKVRSKIFGLLN
ncbi:glycosyltransferase family 2 protein [Vibrio chagasii]|uniref:glycosyltransferase family 2 protein n=3 Tax=Vibrio TaxID=662 RepID=UPI00354D4474